MKNPLRDLMLKINVTLSMAAFSVSANAQEALDERITGDGGWVDQLTAVGILVLAAAFLAGVGSVSYGIWYYMKKSDNPQEQDAGGKALKWILGGSALTVVPVFIGIFALTLGGDGDAVNSANDQLNNFSQ